MTLAAPSSNRSHDASLRREQRQQLDASDRQRVLRARPGDVVSSSVDDKTGDVTVRGPGLSERLGPWLGRWASDNSSATTDEIDTWLRDMRGA